jgi:molecular chaperone DnaK
MPKKYQDEITKLKEDESNVMRGNNYFMVEGHYQKALRLMNNVILYTPTLLIHYYHHYSSLSPEDYTDFGKAKKEIERGDKALERQHYDDLRTVLMTLSSITKNTEAIETKIKGTGLG